MTLGHIKALVGAIFFIGLLTPSQAKDQAKEQEPPPESNSSKNCRISLINYIARTMGESDLRIHGREEELGLVIPAIRAGKSVILVGEHGSGRTSITEKFAQLIKNGEVPALKDTVIVELDWKTLIHSQEITLEGKTPESILAEIVESKLGQGKRLILSISEIDVLFAQGEMVQINAVQQALANQIRQYIAQEKIQVIGEAKTTAQLGNNPAVIRHFENIRVESFGPNDIKAVLTTIYLPQLSSKYGVKFDDTAIDAVIVLAERYFPSEPQLQKARDLLEYAAILTQEWNQGSPGRISLLQNQIQNLEDSLAILNLHPDLYSRAIKETQSKLNRLKEEYNKEARVLETIRTLQQKHQQLKSELLNLELELHNEQNVTKRAALKRQIDEIKDKIQNLRKDIEKIESEAEVNVIARVNSLMVLEAVRARVQRSAVYSGADNLDMAINLLGKLVENVKGQDRNLEKIADVIIRRLLGLEDPDSQRPIAIFIAGPTGTGKDLTLKTLNLILTHGATEYDPVHGNVLINRELGVTFLFGASAGFVGYGPGEFIKRIQKNPNGVVGLDEVEKAHVDILISLMAVLDTGWAEGGDGTRALARNNVFGFTSNLGDNFYNPTKLRMIASNIRTFQDVIRLHSQYEAFESLDLKAEESRFNDMNDPYKYLKSLYITPEGKFSDLAREGIETTIKQHFPPEFIARLDRIVIFDPLSREAIGDILEIEYRKFDDFPFLRNNKNQVQITDGVRQHLIDLYQDISLSGGSRGLKTLVNDELITLIMKAAMDGRLTPGSTLKFVMNGDQIGLEIIDPTQN